MTAIVLFLGIVLLLTNHGTGNRIFASGKTTLQVKAPEEAYLFWKEQGVKGRVLLLFDNYPHARGLVNYDGEPQLSPSNFVEFSVFKNLVRKIYFIVPDADWDEFRQRETIRPIRTVHHLEKGLYIYNLNGIPLIAVTPSSLPHLSEKTLVFNNNHMFNFAQTLELLSRKKIDSDIIISYQGRAL